MYVRDRSFLDQLRLSLGGALLGLSIAGLASIMIGMDRTIPDVVGGVTGFAASVIMLRMMAHSR